MAKVRLWSPRLAVGLDDIAFSIVPTLQTMSNSDTLDALLCLANRLLREKNYRPGEVGDEEVLTVSFCVEYLFMISGSEDGEVGPDRTGRDDRLFERLLRIFELKRQMVASFYPVSGSFRASKVVLARRHYPLLAVAFAMRGAQCSDLRFHNVAFKVLDIRCKRWSGRKSLHGLLCKMLHS